MALENRFRKNPDYGNGIYRRRIRLHEADNAVHAHVLDDYHDMVTTLTHDGRKVTAVDGAVHRGPFDTCAGAPSALQDLVGVPLGAKRSTLYSGGRARRNCTHLFDIAALSMGLAASAAMQRQFDFVIVDETALGMRMEASVDGSIVHQWTVRDATILTPSAFAGVRMFGGYVAWAEATFEGVVRDAALHVQKAAFVARGRRFLVAEARSQVVRDEPDRQGACYSFSEPQFSVAVGNRGFVRDFTAGLPD